MARSTRCATARERTGQRGTAGSRCDRSRSVPGGGGGGVVLASGAPSATRSAVARSRPLLPPLPRLRGVLSRNGYVFAAEMTGA